METSEPLNLLFTFVGKVILAGGGLTLIIYQAFKHLSVKWLESKFNERLQELKHRQGKEIERLRFKIATMLDRATKLHQREFDVLPEAWSKINEAYWATGGLVASIRYYPQLDKMNEEDQEGFIASCRLKEEEKKKLHETKTKTEYYRECVDWRDLIKAENMTRETSIYLAKNGIFISDPICEKFEAMRGVIWSALVEKRINEEHRREYGWQDMYEGIHHFVENGDKQLKELGKLVHDRLWSVDTGSVTPLAESAADISN